jgi:hypothetical protein
VADQNVDLAEYPLDSLDESWDGPGIRQVGGEPAGLTTGCSDGCHRGVHPSCRPGDDCDHSTGGTQLLGDRPLDTTTRSGHQSDSAIERSIRIRT